MGIFWTDHKHFAWAICTAAALVLFLMVLPGNIRSALLRGLWKQRFLTGMLICFGLLSLSVLWSAGDPLDDWIFLVINLRGRRPRWLDGFMAVFTQFGSGIASLIAAIILFKNNYHRLAYEIILGTLSLWLLVELIKAIVRRARPFITLAQTRVVGIRAIGRSFPSGHTSQAFFLATLLAQYYHPNVGIVILFYGLAVLVAVTRMYVGAHYPRDVVAGAILGSIWGLLGVIVDSHFWVGRG